MREEVIFVEFDGMGRSVWILNKGEQGLLVTLEELSHEGWILFGFSPAIALLIFKRQV